MNGKAFLAVAQYGVLSKRLLRHVMALLRQATDRGIKRALRKQTETAKRHGIFGAPSWRTANGELFWGNDRLEDALAWARDP